VCFPIAVRNSGDDRSSLLEVETFVDGVDGLSSSTSAGFEAMRPSLVLAFEERRTADDDVKILGKQLNGNF
jgi:hypothetical protein